MFSHVFAVAGVPRPRDFNQLIFRFYEFVRFRLIIQSIMITAAAASTSTSTTTRRQQRHNLRGTQNKRFCQLWVIAHGSLSWMVLLICVADPWCQMSIVNTSWTPINSGIDLIFNCELNRLCKNVASYSCTNHFALFMKWPNVRVIYACMRCNK